MAGEPYRDTSVPVERSKTQIRNALKSAGARGLQLEEEWAEDGSVTACLIRFIWPTEEGAMIRVRFSAAPLPPEKGVRGGWKVDADQRERQAWRGLAWYIESMIKASTFGLIRFEEIFLAYFEDDKGRRIGDVLIPQIETGRLQLTEKTG
jgi:hypothetical protein